MEENNAVCNINPKDIARRRRSGEIFACFAYFFSGMYLTANVFPILLIAMTASFFSALGYLQARRKHCVGYSFANLDSFGNDKVKKAASNLKKSRLVESFRIIALAALVSLSILLILIVLRSLLETTGIFN